MASVSYTRKRREDLAQGTRTTRSMEGIEWNAEGGEAERTAEAAPRNCKSEQEKGNDTRCLPHKLPKMVFSRASLELSFKVWSSISLDRLNRFYLSKRALTEWK